MGLLDITCPHCGSSLTVRDESATEMSCPFCGKRIAQEQTGTEGKAVPEEEAEEARPGLFLSLKFYLIALPAFLLIVLASVFMLIHWMNGENSRKIAELEQQKTALLQEARLVNEPGADKVLSFLAALDYRKKVPSAKRLTAAFFKENGIEYRPFDKAVYEKMLRGYIRRKTDETQPLPLSERLAALRKDIDMEFAAASAKRSKVPFPSIDALWEKRRYHDDGYYVWKERKNGKGRYVKKYYVRRDPIRINRHSMNRLDPELEERRRTQRYDREKEKILADMNEWENALRKSPEAEALRLMWAWKAGWLPVNDDEYVSIREIFRKWIELTREQHDLSAPEERPDSGFFDKLRGFILSLNKAE